MTGAGVSAGIDLVVTLAGKIAGAEVAQTIQLAIEYDPHPSFDAGAPSKAPKPIYDMAVAALGDSTDQRQQADDLLVGLFNGQGESSTRSSG